MQNLIALFCLLMLFTTCTSSESVNTKATTTPSTQLGDLDFKVTGAAEAQPIFEKALLLLHSFEYEDARTEFLNVQAIDSSFAMAYWGEAMSYNHSLWQRQEKEKAIAALNKLAPSPEARAALIKTELEKDFFQAIEILFADATKYENDLAYKDFMAGLTKKYPDNLEVSAFYAIALLGSSRNGRDEILYGQSARIAQGIIKENPKHPGALHYLIHSYDDPQHAHLAKQAADSYSKTAPDAAHALHMPSHIYVALGEWDDVVTSNIASWNASVKRKEKKELEIDALSYHAFNWLQYGLLQKGDTEQANKLLQNMVKYNTEKPTKSTQSYLLAMKAAQMVETNTWEGDIADIELNTKNLNITKRAAHAFLEGSKAYHHKDAKSLVNIIHKMQLDRNKEQLRVGKKGFAMCSTGGFADKPPSQLDIDMAHVMEMELQAYLASMTQKMKKANEWFEKAAKLDESLSYSYGPPAILKPIHEAYGEWLLSQNKTPEALAIFEKSLKRHPKRLLSLQGKKKAATLLKQDIVRQEVDKELENILAKKEREAIL